MKEHKNTIILSVTACTLEAIKHIALGKVNGLKKIYYFLAKDFLPLVFHHYAQYISFVLLSWFSDINSNGIIISSYVCVKYSE